MPNEYARGHVHFFGPFAYRSEFWSSSAEQEGSRALRHLERVIQAEGADSIAAILLETIPGTSGVLVLPPGYLSGVRALADRYGIVLIFDEVMCGFGRAGAWFAFQALAERNRVVEPDLITFAKGVNSGYVPVGGVILSKALSATFDTRVFPGGLTYSGHPLAMASIVGALDAMRDEGIVENAQRIGREALAPGLAELAAKHPVIGDIRGLGVFWALDLVTDRATRVPVDGAYMAAPKSRLLELGLLPFTAENRLHVVPPCVVTDDEIRAALALYDEAFTQLSKPGDATVVVAGRVAPSEARP